MLEKIKKILLDYVDMEADQITGESEFVKDLGMDSFTVMSVIGQIEEDFDITIDVEDLTDIVTVQNLADYLSEKL